MSPDFRDPLAELNAHSVEFIVVGDQDLLDVKWLEGKNRAR